MNAFFTHLIFKSKIGLMEATLSLTNLLVNLKLDCIKMCKRHIGDVHVLFLNKKEKSF
jgi:hypothetical protein